VPALLIDMPSGIAGDMLLAALVDLGGDLAHAERDLLALGIGPIRMSATRVQRSGISALLVDVHAEQEPRWSQPTAQPGKLAITPVAANQPVGTLPSAAHGHRPYAVIRDLLTRAPLPPRVAERAQRVFRALAEAEGAVHGVPADVVEFHEVGALDAIADVVGCCLLLEQLGVTRIVAGPLLPGEGWVRCAHGRMPVPVPAVAALLATYRAPQRRVGRETGELTTPTGCALVCALADAWLDDAAPALRVSRVGYGAGHKDFADSANVVRCQLLAEEPVGDVVDELRCELDDATGEQLAAALTELLAAGARDAYLTPLVMKKGRPGHLLTVLSAPADRERLARLVLARTPTIGVRWTRATRLTLPRRIDHVDVRGRTIAIKVVIGPDGEERAKPEADAVAAAAEALGVGFAELQAEALRAWQER
jgi:hypothetical protein